MKAAEAAGTDVGEYAVIVGPEPSTKSMAVEAGPLPPSVEDAVTLLFLVPTVVPRTFTEKLHEPLAARVAPERLTEVEPAATVIVPPPQLPVSPLGVATTKPDGKESVNETSVCLEWRWDC